MRRTLLVVLGLMGCVEAERPYALPEAQLALPQTLTLEVTDPVVPGAPVRSEAPWGHEHRLCREQAVRTFAPGVGRVRAAIVLIRAARL